MRVLLIDDEPDSVGPLRDELKERGLDSVLCGFEEAEEKLVRWRPDAVVLDLLQGRGPEAEGVGVGIFDIIWGTRFCPIVVYSAEPERLEEIEHPLVALVKKGSGSEELARQALENFLPAAEALEQVAHRVDIELHQALKRVAPDLSSADTGRLTRAALRQMAVRMDVERFGSPLVHPEEQYVYPPVHESLLTGDLLRLRDFETLDPSAYRLVLTPSCDLVASAEREPKVESVLVAKCGPVSRVRANRSLRRVLQAGSEEALIILPPLDEILPMMVADLKDLELVEFNCISPYADDEDTDYIRCVSIDSPFREHVTWCYLQVAGRPGLPDRDVTDWAASLRAFRDASRTAEE